MGPIYSPPLIETYKSWGGGRNEVFSPNDYKQDLVNNRSYRFRTTRRKPIRNLERLHHTLRYKDIQRPIVTYSFLGILTHSFLCRNNTRCYNIGGLLNSTFCFRFYYPFGKPETQQQWDTIVKTITDFFMSLPNSQASKHHFGQIAKVTMS